MWEKLTPFGVNIDLEIVSEKLISPFGIAHLQTEGLIKSQAFFQMFDSYYEMFYTLDLHQ